MKEGIPFSVKAYLEPDYHIGRGKSALPKHTGEDIPVNRERGESQLEASTQQPHPAVTGEIEQKDEIQGSSRHARFQAPGDGVSGEMVISEEVKIVNISIGGIALNVHRKLTVGKEYVLNLYANNEAISVSAEMTRFHLSGWKTNAKGNNVPLYLVGMAFKNVSPKRGKEIAEFIYNHEIDGVKIDTGSRLSGTRLFARVRIDSSDKHRLNLQTRYRVKVLSMGGMLIESEESANLNNMVHMKIYLPEDRSISSLGRIVSCRTMGVAPEHYDMGIEFIEMSEEDREKLKTFLQVISDAQELGVTSDSSDAPQGEMIEQMYMDANKSGVTVLHDRYAGDIEANSNAVSKETDNHQALNLLKIVKDLLKELREELLK